MSRGDDPPDPPVRAMLLGGPLAAFAMARDAGWGHPAPGSRINPGQA
jgi:hypothetical protein